MDAPDVALVSIMKNEAPYILEFVSHYRTLGFRDIFIATNDNSDRSVDVFKCLKDIGVVDFKAHSCSPDQAPQKRGLRLCLNWLMERGRECMVFSLDADEFLILKEDSSIQSYLARFPKADLIAFNWKFFGSDGHALKPDGLVMENYLRRAPNDFRENKTIKSCFRFDSNLRGFGPHFPHFVDPTKTESIFSDGIRFDASLTREGTHQNQSWARAAYGLASLNHYGLKSKAEFVGRKARGRPSKTAAVSEADPRYTEDYFKRLDRNEIYDPVDAAWIAQVKTEMWRLFDRSALCQAFEPIYFGLTRESERYRPTC